VKAANLFGPGERTAWVIGYHCVFVEEFDYGIDVCSVVCRNVRLDGGDARLPLREGGRLVRGCALLVGLGKVIAEEGQGFFLVGECWGRYQELIDGLREAAGDRG